MKTSPQVIKCLQTAAASESHAVIQYMANAACLENWGLEKLAKKFAKEAEEERGHLGRFLDRIAFVESYPEFGVEAPAEVKTVGDVINGTLALEKQAVSQYQGCIDLCWKTDDKGTATLFQDILKDEEDHLNWVEGQKNLLDTLGEKLYTMLWVRK